MTTRTAILSDIHGNLEALNAVLADASALGAGRAVCLGDILGYGADVAACVDRVREFCEWSLLGDHEWTLREFLAGRLQPNPQAKAYLEWESRILVPGRSPQLLDQQRWNWIRRLETQKWEGEVTYLHGRPTDPIQGWLPLEEGRVPAAMGPEWETLKGICFHGHTHVAGIIQPGGKVTAIAGHHDVAFDLDPGGKSLVNVGSVGQPRDDNPAACYVLHEGCRVRFRRVSYDIEAALSKIQAVPAIAGIWADRLKSGR